jgi:hypothetical protein
MLREFEEIESQGNAVKVTVNKYSKEENLRHLSRLRPRILPPDYFKLSFSDPDVKRIITVVPDNQGYFATVTCTG